MAPKERCSVVRIHWKIVVLGVGPILRSLDSDDDGNLSYEASNVSLTLARLQSFHGVATEEVDEDATKNVYSRNGRDKRRIKKACESPQCSCQCKVPYQVMVKICVAFWALAKAAQDAILWSLQSTGRGKRYYDFEGWTWVWYTCLGFIIVNWAVLKLNHQNQW